MSEKKPIPLNNLQEIKSAANRIMTFAQKYLSNAREVVGKHNTKYSYDELFPKETERLNIIVELAKRVDEEEPVRMMDILNMFYMFKMNEEVQLIASVMDTVYHYDDIETTTLGKTLLGVEGVTIV